MAIEHHRVHGRCGAGLAVSAGTPAVSASYVIHGGRPLAGTVEVAGAKNAVTKQMLATLLCQEPCVLENVPRSSEVSATLDMLSSLGTRHEWQQRHTLVLHTPELKSTRIGTAHHGLNRVPVLALAPLLHRAGEAGVPLPGGCAIGPRHTDFHLGLLAGMGARIEISGDGYIARGRLRAARITLPYPSVGATESAILAAVLAEGRTEIGNAAVEPEILDTVRLLRRMGARIRLSGPRRIVVEGVRRLWGARHRVMPDRTEASSWAVAAAATGGRIRVVGAERKSLAPFLHVLRAAGAGWSEGPQRMTFFRQGRLGPVSVRTGPFPEFSTDALPPLVVLLTQACGTSQVHETVFEDRLGYALGLEAAGARLTVTDACLGAVPCRFAGQGHFHSCQVHPSRLRGARLSAPDLRGGFAMALAALVAEGTSRITHMERVERGYAEFSEKLLELGAEVRAETGCVLAAA